MEVNIQQRAFARQLWLLAEPIYLKIISHPFVSGLANGTLPEESFAHYLSQDILYLQEDNRALKMLAQKATDTHESTFLLKLASDGLEVENMLLSEFLSHFNIQQATEMSVMIKKYTSFLTMQAENSTYPIAAAALLPCFWLYYRVGLFIKKLAIQGSKYQKWVDTYSGAEYEKYILKFIDIVEKQAVLNNDSVKKHMQEAFFTSCQYELAFFEESYSIQSF